MLHYRFPPTQVVSSKRLAHVYLSAQPHFEEIFVLTSREYNELPHDPQLEISPQHLEVVSHIDLRSLRRIVVSGDKQATVDTRAKRSAFGRQLLQLRKTWPFFYLFDDGGRNYVRKMLKRAKNIIQAENITHLFTSYGPYADHWIAAQLKVAFPHLCWIADFRDPLHNQAPFKPLWPRKQERVNRKILEKANVITAVSKGVAETLSPYHSNVELLYNGMGPMNEHPLVNLTAGFTMHYTGSLYGRWEAIRLFLQCLKQIIVKNPGNKLDLQFCYYGPDHHACRELIQREKAVEFCQIHETIGMKDSLSLQASSHINLLLSWSHPEQKGILSAKLFEYLSAQRPIFAIIDGPSDPEMTHWVEQIENRRCLFMEEQRPEMICRELSEFITEVHTGQWQGVRTMPKEAFWSYQADKLWNTVRNSESGSKT